MSCCAFYFHSTEQAQKKDILIQSELFKIGQTGLFCKELFSGQTYSTKELEMWTKDAIHIPWRGIRQSSGGIILYTINSKSR